MILLGSFDNGVTRAQRDAYLAQAAVISGGHGEAAAAGSDKLSFAQHAPDPAQAMTVAQMQQALKTTGIFGPSTQQHLERWTSRNLAPEWISAISGAISPATAFATRC